MSIKETIVTGKKFRKLADETTKQWQRISFWHKASDCEFDDGTNAQSKLGDIKGITASTTVRENGYAADAKVVSNIFQNLNVDGKPFIFDYQNGKFGYNTDPGRGADSFSPFSEIEKEKLLDSLKYSTLPLNQNSTAEEIYKIMNQKFPEHIFLIGDNAPYVVLNKHQDSIYVPEYEASGETITPIYEMKRLGTQLIQDPVTNIVHYVDIIARKLSAVSMQTRKNFPKFYFHNLVDNISRFKKLKIKLDGIKNLDAIHLDYYYESDNVRKTGFTGMSLTESEQVFDLSRFMVGDNDRLSFGISIQPISGKIGYLSVTQMELVAEELIENKEPVIIN